MANYTSKRKYTKKSSTPKKVVKKEVKKVEPVVAPVKEASLLEKAVSWVKSLVK